jgi:hypothetical protein
MHLKNIYKKGIHSLEAGNVSGLWLGDGGFDDHHARRQLYSCISLSNHDSLHLMHFALLYSKLSNQHYGSQADWQRVPSTFSVVQIIKGHKLLAQYSNNQNPNKFTTTQYSKAIQIHKAA